MLFRRTKSASLPDMLDGCLAQKPAAQKQLFERYYSLGVNICLRYASSREEAEELFDDGFMRVLNKLHYYDRAQPFEAWFRTVMVRSAIDHYRRNQSRPHLTDIEDAYDVGQAEGVLDQLSAEDILKQVQLLPPAARTVFSLYVVEGYTHAEIATMLGINEGTSRSNLAKARAKLQELLMEKQFTNKFNRSSYV